TLSLRGRHRRWLRRYSVPKARKYPRRNWKELRSLSRRPEGEARSDFSLRVFIARGRDCGAWPVYRELAPAHIRSDPALCSRHSDVMRGGGAADDGGSSGVGDRVFQYAGRETQGIRITNDGRSQDDY